jgi:hypothetical protein
MRVRVVLARAIFEAGYIAQDGVLLRTLFYSTDLQPLSKHQYESLAR